MADNDLPPDGRRDTPAYVGAERRADESADRRRKPRGGRRATDAFVRAADFVYKLLTEPPR